MAISDERALAALPRNDNSFLEGYVQYCRLKTPSPLVYHLGVGLGLLAVSCREDYVIEHVFPSDIYPNFWGLLIGKSASGKTQAINQTGSKFLDLAGPNFKLGDPRSEEGFRKSLKKQGRRVLLYPEFQSFLGATAGNSDSNYRAKIRDALTEIFDSNEYTGEKANETIELRNLRVSLIGACTPTGLRNRTTMDDWDGGFMSRFCMFYGAPDKEKKFFVPTENDDTAAVREWLIDSLAMRMHPGNEYHRKPGRCRGLTKAAREFEFDWLQKISNLESSVDPRFEGCMRRVPLIGQKIAAILAWDHGAAWHANGEDWEMDLDVLEPACAIADLHADTLIDFITVIPANESMAVLNQILDAIPSDSWISTGELLRKCGLLKRQFWMYMETLEERGDVRKEQQDYVMWWKRNESCVLPTWNEPLVNQVNGLGLPTE